MLGAWGTNRALKSLAGNFPKLNFNHNKRLARRALKLIRHPHAKDIADQWLGMVIGLDQSAANVYEVLKMLRPYSMSSRMAAIAKDVLARNPRAGMGIGAAA